MSAHLVSRQTIDILVSAASTEPYRVARCLQAVYDSQSIPWDWFGEPDYERYLGMLGRYLWSVNARSVLFRYPNATLETMPTDSTLPTWKWGSIGPLPDYSFTRSASSLSDSDTDIGASVLTISAAQDYGYQSCELPEWESTPAFDLLHHVVFNAAGVLTMLFAVKR